MAIQQDFYYRLTPGLDVVPLDDGNVLLRSDTLAVRLEGQSALFFVEQILPHLDGQHSLSSVVATVPHISEADLKHYLDTMVQARVLDVALSPPGPVSPGEQEMGPFLAMLNLLGIPGSMALERLTRLRVAIFGLEGHGAELAAVLVRSGVGTIILVDPYPCHTGNLSLMPFLGPDAVNRPRQEALQEALISQGKKSRILTGPEQEVTRDSVAALASGCDMMVGCFGRSFISAQHWINDACLAAGIPSIYAEVRAHTGLVGPLVLPGQTACYMCYRMRNIACADDFNLAMSYEEYLDRQKRPALHEHGVLPALLPYLAGVVSLEILKILLPFGQSSLAGRILEFDALTLQTRTHTILREPDCPVCGVKKKISRRHPLIDELRQPEGLSGHIPDLAEQLISEKTGIIRRFQRVEKDTSEPFLPHIWWSEPANSGFAEKEAEQENTSSGKGMSLQEAQSSALGEAVERYSAGRWNPSEIVYARHGDLEGECLDPRRMVLYADDQYADLPFVPYRDETVMGWVHACSLVKSSPVWVPALGVFFNYTPRSDSEHLFPVTSNGLATGPTLLEAILKATLEVLERDSFMITWMNRMPCRRISLEGYPRSDIIELCEAYRRRGMEIQLCLLPTDHPCHVFAAFGVQRGSTDGPAYLIGLGADLDPVRAARQAILEVAQMHPILRRQMRNPEIRDRIEELAANPCLVTSLDDHDLLYAGIESSKALDFIFSSPETRFEWDTRYSGDSADKLDHLIGFFRNKGWDLIYYNLTPPDMEGLGLYTARVIIPDFQPIDFGWNQRRLGGDRLYELPRLLGYTADRVTRKDLNPYPHPLA